MKVDQNKNIDFTQLKITSNGPLSKEFVKLNCNNFQEAFAYMKNANSKRQREAQQFSQLFGGSDKTPLDTKQLESLRPPLICRMLL